MSPRSGHAQQATSAATPIVFDGVTVVDVEHGNLLPDQRVVIVGNRIQAMGNAGTVRTPAEARVVDAHGKYLIPGFWDMHVHTTAYVPYLLLIANGVTGIRDCWSFVPLDTMIRWRREILAGTRVGPPRQFLSGVALNAESQCSRRGPSGHVCVADPADARHVVDSLQAAGADFIKTYTLGNSIYFAVASEARKIHIPFGGHLNPGVATAMQASDSGALFLDHLNMSGDLDKLCLAGKRFPGTVASCKPLADRFRQNNTWFVPTLTGPYFPLSAKFTGFPASFDSVRLRFKEVAKAYWTGTLPKVGWLTGAAHEMAFDSAGVLSVVHRAGVPFVSGTDTDVGPPGMWDIPSGFAIHYELAFITAAGIPPLEALQSVTLNPAKALHATDSLGTVAQGKLADLILLDANPLVDITNTTTIRAVVANGRYFDRVALDHMLAEAQTEAKKGFTYWWSDAKEGTVVTGQKPQL